MKAARKLALLLAGLGIMALPLMSTGAASASHKAPARTDPITTMYVTNAGVSHQLTANGAGNSPIISFNGANLDVNNCGQNAGRAVRAWDNANGLYVHGKTGGVVTMEHNSTNGCSNNADRWIDTGGNNGGRQWTNTTYDCMLWTTGGQGDIIKCSNAPGGYYTWTGGNP